MDLIYMNADKEDIGVLQEYELDLEIGGQNDFECTLAANSHCCHEGYFLYIEGTEYGGIIDGIKSDTGTKDVAYTGRTWHGILGSKVILPLQETDASMSGVTVKTTDSKGNSLVNRYLIVSGDANSCIQYIIDRAGLSDMFAAPGNASGFNVNQYQFHRYTDVYTGLQKMLASAGLKLHLEYRGGKVIVSAKERFDYSKDDSFDSDMLDFRVAKQYKTVNHLICLGAGELEKRTVIHLYADTEGNISQTQTQFGFDEYSAVYDFSSVESEEELLQYGTDELKSLWKQDELSLDFDESMDAYDVGDIVGAVDNVTGVAISSVITKKIVTIKNGKISIDLSTDNVSATGSGATGDGEVTGIPENELRIDGNTALWAFATANDGYGFQAGTPGSGCEFNLARMNGSGPVVMWVNGGNQNGAIYTEGNPPSALNYWPVGSIYMSTDATSPAAKFGGSWEQIVDRFLVGAGSGYPVWSFGGEYAVTLTEAQMPSHTHNAYHYLTGGTSPNGTWGLDNVTNKTFGWNNGYVSYSGGNQPHNNIPPYAAVYMWRRTA